MFLVVELEAQHSLRKLPHPVNTAYYNEICPVFALDEKTLFYTRVGSPAFNKTLSEQRAQAVRDRLVSLGVKTDRLEAHGYGSERPLVPNVTAGNRARNRRVALVILDQDK